jgi:hypothetical protein
LTWTSIRADFERKVLKCTPSTPALLPKSETQSSVPGDLAVKSMPAISVQPADHFEVPYDKLVIAVGAYSQSMPGLFIWCHLLA